MIRINLLEVREERRKLALNTLIATAAVVWGLTLAILIALHMSLLGEIEAVRGDILREQEEVARLQKIVGEVEKEQGKKKELEDKLAIIDGLERTRGELVAIMTAVAETMPPEVWARDMEIVGGDISMKASAIDMQSIGSYVKQLKTDPRFVDPQTGDIRVAKDGVVDFTLRVKYVRPGEAASPTNQPAGKENR